MRRSLFDLLICPLCRAKDSVELLAEEENDREIVRGAIRCSSCLTRYPIENGIAVLLHPELHAPVRDEAALPPRILEKRRQIAHFNRVGLNDFEITRPHSSGRVYNFLLRTKMDTALALLGGQSISGRRILDVCCGSGMDAEFLCRSGALVTGVDISLGAVCGAQERARRYGLDYDLIVADTENLPFR